MKEEKRKSKHIRELIKVLNHQDLNPEFYPVRRVRRTEKQIKFYMTDIKD